LCAGTLESAIRKEEVIVEVNADDDDDDDYDGETTVDDYVAPTPGRRNRK